MNHSKCNGAWAAGCLLAGAVVLGLPARAADISWSKETVRYAAVEPKDLRVFLNEFAVQQGMAISIDPEVKGELTGRYSLSPRSMMELLARTFGLVYYYDGKLLHVSLSSSVESEILQLGETTPAQFKQMLDQLGISDSRYPLAVDAERNTVMISGPRRMVQLARQAAQSPERRAARAEAPISSTRIFPLRYAFADDYISRSGGKEHRVPGVVSILRQTYAPGWRGTQPSELGDGASARDGLSPLTPALRSNRRGLGNSANAANAPSDAPPPPGSGVNLPTFAADARTNAVIVRDVQSRLGAYEEMIRALDERPGLVELEVNIIEVNSDDLAELGVDWKILGSRASFETGSGRVADRITDPRGTTPDPTNPLNPATVVGGVQGAVLALLMGNRPQFIARVSALEQGGRATVRAQPRVLTLNNVEAVLESTSTVYARVAGFQDAQLFDINVGTAVRLTPSVVLAPIDPAKPDVQSRLVRLLVRIEDGSLTEQVFDGLPVAQRSNIGTQAIVMDGATLLIAGYSQEREREIRSGVPGLSRLPLVGGAFRSNSVSKQRLERLFMITPRVVDMANLSASKPAPAVEPVSLPNPQ
jgi:type III secretion protein C